jgi:glycerol-3-phosphate acyltransferase PlsX
MGGDNAPVATVEGAVLASREFDLPIILTGRPEVIEAELAKHDHAGLPITIVPASEVIEMTDHPAQAAKRKKDSSMVVGLNLVKSGEASAFASMGNTGAVMAASLFRLGRIKGIKRPANSTVFPTRDGHCFILDVGANAECRPEYLYQFAVMGSIYVERVLEIPNPRVGIISNGEEEGKGNDLVKETFPLLKESKLNFIGNVEGRDVPAGLADVVVTDGFTGNVMVKGFEGIAKMMKELIKEELYRSPISMLGGLLARGAFNRIAKRTDYREYGGAALLGVDGVVIIGHGRSDSRAVRSALRVASQAVESGVVEAIKQGIQ